MPERIVLDDDDLDVESVFHASREFSNQHRQRAVADEGDNLAPGIGDRRGYRVGQSAGHRRQISRTREHHVAAHRQVTRDPCRHRAGIGRNDGVVAEQFVELVRDDLRLHRLVLARAALDHQLVPLLRARLGGLEE